MIDQTEHKLDVHFKVHGSVFYAIKHQAPKFTVYPVAVFDPHTLFELLPSHWVTYQSLYFLLSLIMGRPLKFYN